MNLSPTTGGGKPRPYIPNRDPHGPARLSACTMLAPRSPPGATARRDRVRVEETRRNSFEVTAGIGPARVIAAARR